MADEQLPFLRVDRISKRFGAVQALNDVSFDLYPGEVVALLGDNGAGKSTLIKTLAGVQSVVLGKRREAQGLRIGYFAQHQMDQLRPDSSPLQHFTALDRDATEQSLRDFLGGFGFGGDQATEPVAPFSGGEKARLALALVVYQRPNLLLLDEPTNHLDLEMRHALGTALQDYEGAVVLVSHDRHLLRITCDTLVLVADGRVAPFDGDLDDYPAWISQRAGERRSSSSDADNARNQESDGETAAGKKAARRRDADARARTQPLRRDLGKLEQRLETLTAQREAIDHRLSDNRLYQPAAKSELLAVMEDKRKIDDELADVEQAWLAAGEALEQLQSQQP